MRSKLFFVFMILALVISAPGNALSVSAQNQQPDGPKTPQAGIGSEYLILFAIPQISPSDVPFGIGPEEAERYAARIVERQAEQMLPELKQYLTQGQLSGMEVRSDRNGIVVQIKDPAVLTHLQQLPGVQGVYQSSKTVECSQWTINDLKKAVVAQSNKSSSAGLSPLSTATTDPTINILYIEGDNFAQVEGTTTAGIQVSLRILRAGVVVGTGQTYANVDGSYYFYPSSGGCDSLTNWSVLYGDIIEVTAHGSIVSTVLTSISAWVDPSSNKVGVATAANRTVKIELFSADIDPCVSVMAAKTGNSGASGSLEMSFNDFNRRAYAYVYVQDVNGNSTYSGFGAYGIGTSIGNNYFDFSWKPGETVHATLTRSSAIVADWNETLPNSGYFEFGLGSAGTLQAGDVINVSSGIGSMSYTVVPLTMAFDTATDKITGTTAASYPVIVRVSKNYNSTCTTFGCIKTTANAAGAYTISTALGQGDWVYVYTYDAEGNSQYGPEGSTPYLVAEPSYNDLLISWPNTNSLTVTLTDSANAVKETLSGITPYYAYSSFWVYFSSATMVVGDMIKVTDGVTTIYVTVQSMTPRLNSSTSRLTGTSANGHLTANLYDFRRGQYSSQYYCQETDVTSGSYDLAFNGSQIGPQDSASLYLTGPEGNFTNGYARAFSVEIDLGSSYVGGNTETPGANVTVKLERGGSMIAFNTITSNANGWFYNYWSGQQNQLGDVIVVTPPDGRSATLTLPNLSIAMDPIGNRLYGIAPANEPVYFRMILEVGRYWSQWWNEGFTTADAAGNFNVSAQGLFLYNCNPVIPGSTCTYANAYYYFPTYEHVVYAPVTYPADVKADSYEPDGIFTGASAYAGIQHHTFNATNDVDWVSFTVPVPDVDAGVKYILQTLNLGPGMDTKLELYGTDGTTLLASNDDFVETLASRIEWKPSAAGTYYVKMLPHDSDINTQYCGAFYDLSILVVRSQVFLPALRK
jgi:hypothetical protein